LTKIDLNNLQSKSIYNFLIHYKYLQGDNIKLIVGETIKSYFEEIKKCNYSITIEKSREIYAKYIIKMGQYYNSQLGFKPFVRFVVALYIGFIFDIFLLLLGVLSKVYYIPVATIFFASYNRLLHYYLSKKNKLYGPRY
jgi:hypothetical protein